MAVQNKTALPGEGILAFLKKNRSAVIAAALILVGIALVFSGAVTEDATSHADDVEERLREMCSSLAGVGECRVMVTYKVSGERYGSSGTKTVESVAVVCRGADKACVRAELTEMLSSLFGIGTNRIHISKMR